MRESNKLKVIGIGGCARAGKDTFASILIKQLELKGKRVKRVALADPLKQFCDDFCRKNLGISAFTQIADEKPLIRPMLVWFGDAKRKQTSGRFWVELADKSLKAAEIEGYDYAIITDVRYDHYEKDEAYWLKHEHGGVLVHVSQFSWNRPDTSKVSSVPLTRVFVPPANDHEMLNDPKVAKKADVRVEWENVGKLSDVEMLAHPSLNKHVSDVVRDYILTN
jgi:hypothetical protein